METYFYRAFGAQIQSDLPLPELLPGTAPAEVHICWDDRYEEWQSTYDRSGWLQVDRQEAVLFVRDAGRIKLEDGRVITVSPAPQARESLIRLYLTGTVLGNLAYQRGKLALHGSAIGVNGRAVAILAESGSGKSSLAAALQQRGHTVLADDLVVVETTPDGNSVQPGYPQIKLEREVAAALGIPRPALHLLDPKEPKLGWRANNGFPRKPVRLQKIYILAEGESPAIDPLPSQQAVIELVRHSYPTRLAFPADGQHLKQCGQLARDISVQRLKRTTDLRAIFDLTKWIEADLSEPETAG